MDPITAFIAGVASACVREVVAELIRDAPLIWAEWQTITMPTLKDARQVPTTTLTALQQELANARFHTIPR